MEIEAGFERDDFVLPEEGQPDTRALAEALGALGFERLGVKWERGTAAPGAEPKLMRSPTFANPRVAAFASIWYSNDGTARVYFFTPFQTGECVFTSAYPRVHHTRTRNAVMTGTTGLTLAEVLAVHGRGVEELKGRGLKVFAAWGKRERLIANELYYRNPDTELRVNYRHDAAAFFRISFTGVAAVSFLIWLLSAPPAPLARAIAATSACAMVGSAWYEVVVFSQRDLPWYRRFPTLVTPIGVAMLAWLVLRP